MKHLFLLIFLLLTTLASAQEPVPAPPEEKAEDSLLQVVTDRFYRETTENLVKLSENLDSFFPNPDNRRFDYRRTRLQAQLGLLADSNGDLLVLQRLSGRIVLPRMEKRLSLYFSGAIDDNGEEEEDAVANPFYIPTIEDTRFRFGFNTALRFVFTKSDLYLVQNQLGARLLPTWDPYDEFSGQLRIPLGRDFLWQPGQAFYWRESCGFGETTRYDLDYAFSAGVIVRLHQEGTLTQESSGYEHLHSLSYLHQINDRRGFTVVFQGQGVTAPVQRMTQYLAVFTWKQLIYQDWLYVETGSRLLFDQEDSFEPLPAIFFNLIVDFNGRKSTPRPKRPREEEAPPL